MRKEKKSFSLILLKFLLLLLITYPLRAQYQIAVEVVSSGGEKQSNAAYRIVGTLTQTSTENLSNTPYQIQTGFWYVYPALTPVEDEEMMPVKYSLEQNYPNPFNPTTVIKFSIPEKVRVLIKIYDILGREVAVLNNSEMDRGWHKIEFNAQGYSSGIYICRMIAGNYISTKKMLMIK